MAVRFLRYTAVRYLDPGGWYIGFWVVQKKVHPLPVDDQHDDNGSWILGMMKGRVKFKRRQIKMSTTKTD